jgi:hypothetical protein
MSANIMNQLFKDIEKVFSDASKKPKEKKVSSDYIKSEFCTECDGEGFIKFISHQTEEHVEYETDQCAECEELHKQEVYVDRMCDIAKGN